MHKTANVFDKLPKAVQPKVKEGIQDIWMAETKGEAYKAFDSTVKRFAHKYPGAMNCLVKDKEQMLAFYDYTAIHWQHIWTSNPLESTFATVRLRTAIVVGKLEDMTAVIEQVKQAIIQNELGAAFQIAVTQKAK